MTEDEIPVDEVTAPWWDATRDGRLLLQRCTRCACAQHPPRLLCTACGAGDLSFEEATGTGIVDSFTVVHRAAVPGTAVPYVLARVRLAEGPILLTHLTGTAEPHCDQPVRLAWRPLPDGRRLPVFHPDPESPWTSS
ncbi:Zn-ribbon domain-containing OB-fold protein [Hamadaea tsunoensis]|uniref:Zn-ribbon domain-containing OB-fold protein n=1 Tax=Hamadaea tsunoensis TaxID=53368 RepID=UPI0003F6499B|nr:OB-fold domain-containing protein [Hamadaea tsunoensis]